MTALCIIMVVMLVLLLLLLIPVGAQAEYDEPGLTLWLRIGALRLKLYPRPSKPEGEKKPKKEKKKKEKEKEKPKKGGTLKLIMELIPVAVDALGRLKRALLIKRLRLYFCFGGEDPAKAAMSFGGASAGAGMLVPLLRNNFRVREMDIRNSVDFTATDTRVYANADIRVRIGAVLAIAVLAGVRALKIFLRQNKTEKNERSKSVEIQKGK